MTAPLSLIFLTALILGVFIGLSKQLSRLAVMLLADKQWHLPPKDGYVFELPDAYLRIQIVSFSETEFEIGFVDGWELGKACHIFGRIDPDDDRNPWELAEFKEKIRVSFRGFSGRFSSTVLGYIDTSHAGEARLYFPQYTVDRLIDELRRDQNQFIEIGFKRVTDKSGRLSLPIYRFSMFDDQ